MSKKFNIDHKAAEILLKSIFSGISDEPIPRGTEVDQLRSVILGTHKTYKYVLVTALLAKANNEHANPLALQAGAQVEGAFDARSLCHKIVVPFEREFLSNALGGSNEPFLNKPARFQTLSTTNAVRSGADKKTLETLINILGSLRTKEEAIGKLRLCLQILRLEIRSRNHPKVSHDPEGCPIRALRCFFGKFLSVSNEGESVVLVSGAVIRLLNTPDHRIEIHKANQSGESSKEVNEIDLYHNNELTVTFEVKDKTMSKFDVGHAISKTLKSKCRRLTIILGPSGMIASGAEADIGASASDQGVSLTIVTVDSLVSIALAVSASMMNKLVVEELLTVADEMNVKTETRRYLMECLRECGLVE